LVAVVVGAVACGGGNPGTSGDDDDAPTDAATVGADAHVQDPADPVEDVPAYTGIYTFAKLTTDENLDASAGMWFTDSVTEHKVSDIEMTYARYRDGMVLHSMFGAQMFIYDQAATTISAPIDLPSDAIGHPIIRGGLVFIGAAGKLYSYEIATKMWRMRTLPNAGGCHHLAAGATRLFAVCKNPSSTNDDDVFTTWANKSMSDVVKAGTLSPGKGADSAWITVAPVDDVAYFGAGYTPDPGCIARATWNTMEPCAFSLRTLTTSTTASNRDGQMNEDGTLLYATAFSGSDKQFYEIDVEQKVARYIPSSVESYATCPDNSVTWQAGVSAKRRAGGVTTDVRLGSGGGRFLGCPLKKQ
jgi:hypothetical protein